MHGLMSEGRCEPVLYSTHFSLGISVRTLQKWEQGVREPTGAAKSLIRIARKHPEVLADAM